MKKSLLKTVFGPFATFYNKNLSKSVVKGRVQSLSDVVFECSKETPMIMLFFNAVAILSGHIAQIGGLISSDRENKDYLVMQEKLELALDLCLTIIPPFILNNALKKRLESGQITTRETRRRMFDELAPAVGVDLKELYNTDHLTSVKGTFSNIVNKSITSLIGSDNPQKAVTPKIKNQKIVEKLRQVRKKFPLSGVMDGRTFESSPLEKITTSFDDLVKTSPAVADIAKKYRNNSAFDEFCGQNNGLLIMVGIAYTIVASNIVMPILKNKISNYLLEKQLLEKGETKESVKRKQRYAYNDVSVSQNYSNVFNVFSNSDNSISSIKKDSLFVQDGFVQNKIKEPDIKSNPFSSFDTYSALASQSTGLRI